MRAKGCTGGVGWRRGKEENYIIIISKLIKLLFIIIYLIEIEL